MSSNTSLVSLATLLALLAAGAAGYSGYQYIRDSAQDDFVLTASYELQSAATQAVLLSERLALNAGYAPEVEVLEQNVDRALASLRNGDPVKGIPPAPTSVAANIDAVQRTWNEIVPSLSVLISRRQVRDNDGQTLVAAQRAGEEALGAAREAVSKLAGSQTSPQLQRQVREAVASLAEGQSLLMANSSANPDGPQASYDRFNRYVSQLVVLSNQLPKDQAILGPLFRSYKRAQSVLTSLQSAVVRSPGTAENISHAKTIWEARERVAAATSGLVAAARALPERRPIDLTMVAGIWSFALLMSIVSMLIVRSISLRRTALAETRGRTQDLSITSKSTHLAKLVAEIEEVTQGRLNTKLTETNESTAPIAQALNKTFGRFAAILEDVRETILGLQAATEQTMVTEKNVAKNRKELDLAIEQIARNFADLISFIIDAEAMTLQSLEITSEMGVKVADGEHAVKQVHTNIGQLQQQTVSIQHSSKHMIESFQVLENIAAVVDQVGAKAQILSFNANLMADELQDKAQQGRISSTANAMTRLAEEMKTAAVEINVQLRSMNDAARANQSAVDHVQRETDKLHDRSNIAQEALATIKELAATLSQEAAHAGEQTKLLKEKSGDMDAHIRSVRQYSQDNGEASEETANAIQNVNSQALALEKTISQFSTERS